MGPFYAYLKNDQDDTTGRALLTFVSRDVADEWWRMISTPPSTYASFIRRISPQFYVYGPNTPAVESVCFSNIPESKKFLEKMFTTWLNDYNTGRILSVFPPLDVTDHISGNWYFIRSRSDHRRHWYFCVDGECLVCGETDCETVHVSTERRSRFRIQVHNVAIKNFQLPKSFVMIGSDEISIAPSKEFVLRVTDAEELKATKACNCAALDLHFGDLQNRFVAHAERQGNDGPICESIVPVERGFGEAWELVD